MRLIFAFCLLSAPVAAWEFSPQPICTLSHAEDGLAIRVTHDPRRTEAYAIRLTRPRGWPDGPVFALRFDPFGPVIVTDRHRREGERLIVTDRGFGNVLNGLAGNRTATALIGDLSVTVPLDGAAPEVAAFRACAKAPSV